METSQPPVGDGHQCMTSSVRQELLLAVHDFLDDLNSVRKHDAEWRGDHARLVERIIVTQDGDYFEADVLDGDTDVVTLRM